MHVKPGLVAPLVALGLVAAACGGGSSGTKAAQTVPTRPSDTVSTVANNPAGFDTPPSTTAGDRKSQPYWVPLASFDGTGNTTTKGFTVDNNALQWRVSWHCDAAPFTVVSVNGAGQESKRKLADALACPTDSQGFSADKGAQTLKVTTAGAWKMTVEQQVDTPLVEPAPAALASAKVLGTATLYNVDKVGEGTAKIYQLPDGSRTLRLENFYVSLNSDLEIRLSTVVAPKSTPEVEQAPFSTVAPLKATVGSMNYDVPKDVDLTMYKSIVIWCEITRNAYAAATIK
ncbi:MAG TPA: DM13 domain-containing protein [Acidimicrobiales bacterium]|jgi:hypothetical protein|nr:DM13 domain-containing protein [Acidimicrobiales bacterium]